jgi:Undecaprenyl-phosphate glucose phosphotransferase
MICLDTLAILSAGVVTYGFATVGGEDTSYYAAAIAFVWLVAVTLLKIGGLYELDAILKPIQFIDKLLLAFAVTFLFLMAGAFSLKVSAEYSRLWTGSFALACCTGSLVIRLIAAQGIGQMASRRWLSRNAVLVGSGEQIQKMLGHIEGMLPRFVSVLGVFCDDVADLCNTKHQFLGKIDDLAGFVRAYDVDDVVISLPWAADEKIAALVDRLRELPVNIYLGADLIGFRMQLRKPPDHFGALPLVELMGRPLAGWGGFQKAMIDYLLGTMLIIVLVPVMILIALLIRLESEGPVLFRQERYGFANRRFHIYKFRTMFQRTAGEHEGITIQASQNDPRVTRIGRILRRFSLDELPQLFNVLNGTMSLVGPRPHAVDHNEAYAQQIRGYFARHRVKPGLTGWAQVNGFRGETKTLAAMEARVKYDIYYVENWTLLFDLKILVMTAGVCLTGRNAY